MRNKAWGHLDNVVLYVLPGIMLVFSAMGFLGYNHGSSTEWYVGFTNIFCAAMVTILPLLKRKGWFIAPYWLIIPVSLNVMMYGISLFLGFYHYFWWWDEFTHMLSSMLVAILVFIALGAIECHTNHISLPKPAFLLATFLITVGIGNAWELFEGAVDFLVSSNHMQDIDAFDTLTDTTMDAVGALIVVAIGAVTLRKRRFCKEISGMWFEGRMAVMGKRWDRRCISPDDPEYEDICEEIGRLKD